MLEIEKRLLIFKIKEVYFADKVFNIKDCQDLEFKYCRKKLNPDGFSRETQLTLITDLTKDLEEIWSGMHRNTRSYIKKAKKEGVVIKTTNKFDEFYDIYLSLFKQKGILPLLNIFGFGIEPINVLKKYGRLFIYEHDGELLGGDVYLEDEENVCAWVGASKRLNVAKQKAKLIGCASRLSIWRAMNFYKKIGKKEIDHGGMWPKEEAELDRRKRGINQFKSGFGGEIVTRYNYRKINSRIYDLARRFYNIRNI